MQLNIALQIEGQNGLTWPRWQRIALAAEELGFAGLYRSDHFTNANGPDKDSLELWVSFTWLASHTKRIPFGPLVSPVSFRNPVFTARTALQIDDLSGGRLVLGLGAGWQDREHDHFGFDLLPPAPRFQRFEEGMQVITRLMRSDEPVDFSGEYYRLQEAILLPRPQRRQGPPILIGGNGIKRSVPMAVRYASEWNTFQLSPQKFTELNQEFERQMIAAGRQPRDVIRSMMLGAVFGKDQESVEKRVKSITGGSGTVEELRQRGLLVGTAPALVEQLSELAQAGVEQVMLQWLDLDDLEGLELIARDVLPHFEPARNANQL